MVRLWVNCNLYSVAGKSENAAESQNQQTVLTGHNDCEGDDHTGHRHVSNRSTCSREMKEENRQQDCTIAGPCHMSEVHCLKREV